MKQYAEFRFLESPLLSYQLLFFFLTTFLMACGGASNSSESKSETNSDSIQCANTANYTVVFESTWSASTHPSDFPANPHFSGLIGATHNENVRFWEEGAVASLGIESMAEGGSKSDLSNEVSTAINVQNADAILSGGGISPSPGSVSLSFEISPDFPNVTLVSMLAPSPDWFVGVSNISLCETGEWVSTQSIDLFAYDAGTDSGEAYTSSDLESTPQEKITKLTTGVFEVNGTVPLLGTFTFIKN